MGCQGLSYTTSATRYCTEDQKMSIGVDQVTVSPQATLSALKSPRVSLVVKRYGHLQLRLNKFPVTPATSGMTGFDAWSR
jgi:hypothetical protein